MSGDSTSGPVAAPGDASYDHRESGGRPTTTRGAHEPEWGATGWRRRACRPAIGAACFLFALPAFSLAADEAATLDADPPPAAESAREPGRFSLALHEFLADGAYLFTFPSRATPKGTGLTAGFAGATLLALHNDDRVHEEISGQDEPERRHVAKRFEFIGRMPVQAGLLGILYAGGRAAGRRGLASTAGTSFEALLWGGIVSQAGKLAMGRRQPTESSDARYFFHGSASFPSGHATRSFAVAAVIADRYGPRGAWTAYPIAALVSAAMVQRGIHWTSDIVAGAGLGLAVGKGIAARHPASGDAAARGGRTRRLAWRLQPAPGGAEITLAF